MFNLSFGEIVIFAIIGLLILGPKELPRIAKILGRTLGELKRSVNEATHGITREINPKDIAQDFKKKLSIDELMKDKKDS